MSLMALIGSGTLLIVGTAFALFMGIASARIEAQRARDIEAHERTLGADHRSRSHAA